MLIDTHCHIDRFPDPLGLSNECESKEIFTVAVTNLPSHYEMATQHLSGMRWVRPALGFHPLSVADNMGELALFQALMSDCHFVGEIGLDYSKQGVESKSQQQEAFRKIATVLATSPRFTTLHSRKSASDVLDILSEAGVCNAVFHWYSDSVTVLRKIADAGHYFSINPAMVLSKSGQAVINTIPRHRILTETDGPYVKQGGKPASPPAVRSVLSGIAELWGVEEVEVEEQVSSNFRTLCDLFSIRLPQMEGKP